MVDEWDKYYDVLYEEADREAKSQHGCHTGQQDTLNPLYDTLCKIHNRYENERLIGEGGWKVIYRVYDTCAGRDVALARPRPDISNNSYDAFLREAHITAKLEHANIIKLYDMGVERDGTPFFTMEFKRGKSLLDRLRDSCNDDNAFPLEDRLHIFLAICDAVSYAHSRRVLHLDLKPENIQIGPFGEVQVCDWGLAEIVIDPNEVISDADALLDPDLYGDNGDLRLVKGTPGYMAPEQSSGEPRTFRTDVYALGKTLAALVGKMPIPALSAIVKKATAHAPVDRYSSVKELRDDVHRFVILHPTSVEPGGLAREVSLFIRRNQRSSVIAVTALIVTMVISAYFIAELKIYHREKVAAQDRADRALSDLVVTEREKEQADTQTAAANDKADKALNMANAILEGRHGDVFAESLLLANVMGADPFNGERTLEETIVYLDDARRIGILSEAQVRHHLGYAHFIAQRFDDSAKYYEGLAADPDLQQIILGLQNKNEKNKPLLAKEFRGLIIKLARKGSQRLSLIEKMMIYDSVLMRKKRTDSELISIAMAVLAAFNSGWSADSKKWDSDARHLELWGEELTALANTQEKNRPYVTSLLQTIPIKSLTLRDTVVKDLSHLSSLNLWQLEIINTQPKSFEPLRQMKSLRIVKVDRSDLLMHARSQLDSYVMVELINRDVRSQ